MNYLLESLIKIGFVVGTLIAASTYAMLAERKMSAYIQNRLGPNRVGLWGLGQPLADVLKLMVKEDVIPNHVDKAGYLIAPAAALIPALMAFAVIPFGDTIVVRGHEVTLVISELDIGLLYVVAMISLGVYGVVLRGWASNNTFALQTGIRASTQMFSYGLSLGLSLIGVVLISGTLRLTDIVSLQTSTTLTYFLPGWFVFSQPVACAVFIVSVFAETNRHPFDMPQAEQEAVFGYDADYGSMKSSMLYVAEYAHIIAGSALIVTFFFGGWHLPGLDSTDDSVGASLLKMLAFAVKTAFFVFVFIWVRWTVPRLRYDQVMRLGWKYLLPIALVNALVTGLLLTITR